MKEKTTIAIALEKHFDTLAKTINEATVLCGQISTELAQSLKAIIDVTCENIKKEAIQELEWLADYD